MNDIVESPVVSLFAPNININNNTIVNSRVPTFISIKSINTNINNIVIKNVSSLSKICFLYIYFLDEQSAKHSMILIDSSS